MQVWHYCGCRCGITFDAGVILLLMQVWYYCQCRCGITVNTGVALLWMQVWYYCQYRCDITEDAGVVLLSVQVWHYCGCRCVITGDAGVILLSTVHTMPMWTLVATLPRGADSIESVMGLVGLVSVYLGWVRKKVSGYGSNINVSK